MNLGDTKPVWHVVGPPGKRTAGQWYCEGTEASARKVCRGIPAAQIYEGVATYSATDGGFKFWDVKRPEWVDIQAAAPPARRV